MTTLSSEQLLAEIEDVIRTMPPRNTIRHEMAENLAWFGRASAVIGMWNSIKAVTFDGNIGRVHGVMANDAGQGLIAVVTMLHQARHDLRLKSIGPLTVSVGVGGVFDYFDEIRKVIESAKSDLLFIDPYLDAEFASRYLPHVSQGVLVRLLAREKLATLLPAVELLKLQSGQNIEVRVANGFHDRYILVDGDSCYQSGASFKDGAKFAPTTLTQIVDAFAAVKNTYEQIWSSATVKP